MRNIVDLTGKAIAITGAASGIGRESAMIAAELGARLALIDLAESGLDDTMSQIGGSGHVKCVADLSKRNDLLAVIQKVTDAIGPIDGLVHCAGISSRRPISLLRREHFDNLMEVNFFSFVELVKSFTKQGRMSDGGSIVVMSSISSVCGYKAKTEYCVSKAAVDAFVRCAALELASRKIRVNSIMPAEVLTPMAQRAREINGSVGASDFTAPLGVTEPKEVANLIAFLLSDATQTMTGTSIRIDGGAGPGGGGKSLKIADNVLFVGDNSDLNLVIQKKLERDGFGVMVYSCENRENFERDIVSLCESQRIDKVVFSHIHSDFRPIQFNTPAVVDKIVSQNFSLFIELMRVLLKRKLLGNSASVVVLSSIGSTEALKAKTIFCAAKAALDASVRCLSKELEPKGIRLNSILKGGTDVDYKKAHIQVIDSINDGATAKRQVLGLTKADEIANLTAFLLSNAVPTMTGTSIVIDGGYTL